MLTHHSWNTCYKENKVTTIDTTPIKNKANGRDMLPLIEASVYKGISPGVLRGWVRRKRVTKGKLPNKYGNKTWKIGIYLDELDKIPHVPKKIRRAKTDTKDIERFNKILAKKRLSVRTIDVLQCPVCHIQTRNLYCINCSGILTVPVFPAICEACGKDLVINSNENSDEFSDRHYCNKECASKYRKRLDTYRLLNPTNLSRIRIKKEMSRMELSKESGIKGTTLNRIEQRIIKSSHISRIKKIATILDVNIEELATRLDQSNGRFSFREGYMQWQ